MISSDITWRVIMNDVFLEFNGIIDEEIAAYEELGDLYKAKQTFLVQRNSDALWDVDAKIIKKAKNIKEINDKRKEIAKYIGSEELTMSEIIERAKEANSEFVDKFEEQRKKLNMLSRTLALQENTNITLVKHGLTMVKKTLDIIVGVISPQTRGQYDKNGQNIEVDKDYISSVVEEV